MLRLALAGPHTQILSTVCARCPHSAAGCCQGPPPMDWSDVGRIVALGGRDWLLEQIAAKHLVPDARGLAIAKAKGLSRPGGPKVLKCVFHGPTGCTVPPERRSATCNYYVCESVLDAPEAKGEAARAREAKDALARRFEAWDEGLAREVVERYPEGVVWDAALLDWLGGRFRELSSDASPAPRAPRRARTARRPASPSDRP